MPHLVPRAPNAGHDRLTLDLDEAQILVGFPEDHFSYHHRLLMVSLGGGKWVVCTPTWDVHLHDLSDEDVDPLTRNSQFPRAGRPYFVFSVPSAASLMKNERQVAEETAAFANSQLSAEAKAKAKAKAKVQE